MSFNTALSGLQAARADLDVTANNIANANTTGFKRSTATFSDVFSDTQSGAADSAGNGVQLAKITQQFDQGKIEDSNSDLHLAINGNGFFALQDEKGTVYTRDGAFLLDQQGFLTSASGLQVQAFPVVEGSAADGPENAQFSNGVLAPIQLTNPIGAPEATDNVTLALNFKADLEPRAGAIDPADQATFDYTTTINVFDSLGNSHQISVYAKRTDNNVYTVAAYFEDSDTPINSTPLQLQFGDDGKLEKSIGPAPDNKEINFDANGSPDDELTLLEIPAEDVGKGAKPLSIKFEYGTSSMLGSAFSIKEQNQDGRSTGRLTGLEIDSDGVVSAGYTNGLREPLGKIALATFGNNQGLRAVGGNTFVNTPESGEPVLGEAGTSTFGLIQAGGLETSNVDISQQLVRLITAQRNFQAASKVISTNDQITQTAINLGR